MQSVVVFKATVHHGTSSHLSVKKMGVGGGGGARGGGKRQVIHAQDIH